MQKKANESSSLFTSIRHIVRPDFFYANQSVCKSFSLQWTQVEHYLLVHSTAGKTIEKRHVIISLLRTTCFTRKWSTGVNANIFDCSNWNVLFFFGKSLIKGLMRRWYFASLLNLPIAKRPQTQRLNSSSLT